MLSSCMTTFTHLTTISLALHVDHGGTLAPRWTKVAPHPVAPPPLLPPRFEHAKRFYCLARKSLVPSLNSGKTAVTTSCPSLSMSKSVVAPKGDWTFVLHILGQILAHNSILHATAGSKFLRVQVASFSITLHRMRQLSASTQLAMTIGSCRLQAAKGFSLSPVVD